MGIKSATTIAKEIVPMIPITKVIKDKSETNTKNPTGDLRFVDDVASGMYAGLLHSYILTGAEIYKTAKNTKLPDQTISQSLMGVVKKEGPNLLKSLPEYSSKMCMKGGAVGLALFLTEQAYKKTFDKSESEDSGTPIKSSWSSKKSDTFHSSKSSVSIPFWGRVKNLFSSAESSSSSRLASARPSPISTSHSSASETTGTTSTAGTSSPMRTASPFYKAPDTAGPDTAEPATPVASSTPAAAAESSAPSSVKSSSVAEARAAYDDHFYALDC